MQHGFPNFVIWVLMILFDLMTWLPSSTPETCLLTYTHSFSKLQQIKITLKIAQPLWDKERYPRGSQNGGREPQLAVTMEQGMNVSNLPFCPHLPSCWMQEDQHAWACSQAALSSKPSSVFSLLWACGQARFPSEPQSPYQCNGNGAAVPPSASEDWIAQGKQPHGQREGGGAYGKSSTKKIDSY